MNIRNLTVLTCKIIAIISFVHSLIAFFSALADILITLQPDSYPRMRQAVYVAVIAYLIQIFLSTVLWKYSERIAAMWSKNDLDKSTFMLSKDLIVPLIGILGIVIFISSILPIYGAIQQIILQFAEAKISLLLFKYLAPALFRFLWGIFLFFGAKYIAELLCKKVLLSHQIIN